MKKRLITSFIFFIFTLVFLINPGFIIMAQEPVEYPNYDATDELFFLTPIKNIIGSTRTVVNLRQELALSGYEAYCAAEAISINPQYNTGSLIETYLEQYPSGISLETDSVEKLGLSQAKYPIWRDVNDEKFLMSSLEEYFGFKDVYEQDPARSEITSAAINSLLSREQACVQGWKNLVVQKTACEKLTNPSECALLPRPIPGTSFSVKTLTDELKKFKSSYKGKEQEGCEELFSETNSKWKDLKIGLTNTPTYFDRAYRYGFVVATIHTLPPEGSGGTASKIFNFFTNATRESSPKDEVLVAAFKLPDIGTNKGRAGHEYWNDSLDLTRMSLITAENNRIHTKEERPAHRAAILENAIGASIQSSSSNIFCSTGEAGSSGENATASCLNALPRALTDIINGNVDKNSCGDTEAVDFIQDVAGLGDVNHPVGKIFKEVSGGQVLLNLFAGSENNYNGGFYDPQNARSEVAGDPDSKLKSIFNITPNTYPPDNSNTTVDFYVVYPMGFELKAIEEAIKGAFFVKSQIETMDGDSSIVDGFKMTGQEISLEGGGVEWDFVDSSAIDKEACEASEAAGLDTGEECKKTKTIKISVGQNNNPEEIAILGGRLGWWLRNVQIALSSKAKLAYDYYKSCETTEEFLLGVCLTTPDYENPAGLEDLDVVAECKAGSARITSGETAEHVDISGTGSCAGKLTRTFSSSIHNIPNWKNPGDSAPSCEDLYSYVACTYPDTLIQNTVNSEGKFDSNGTKTACEFVVEKAKSLGVSPRLALAMWGEESGFSHYRVPDLGIVSQPPQDLGAQVTSFANTLKGYGDYLSFLEAYAGETRGANQFCVNPHFVGRLKTYYDFLDI